MGVRCICCCGVVVRGGACVVHDDDHFFCLFFLYCILNASVILAFNMVIRTIFQKSSKKKKKFKKFIPFSFLSFPARLHDSTTPRHAPRATRDTLYILQNAAPPSPPSPLLHPNHLILIFSNKCVSTLFKLYFFIFIFFLFLKSFLFFLMPCTA